MTQRLRAGRGLRVRTETIATPACSRGADRRRRGDVSRRFPSRERGNGVFEAQHVIANHEDSIHEPGSKKPPEELSLAVNPAENPAQSGTQIWEIWTNDPPATKTEASPNSLVRKAL